MHPQLIRQPVSTIEKTARPPAGSPWHSDLSWMRDGLVLGFLSAVSVPDVAELLASHPPLERQQVGSHPVTGRRWQAGDLVIWDETSTCHRALSGLFPMRRVVRRCVTGTR